MTLDGEGVEVLNDRDKNLKKIITALIVGEGIDMSMTSLKAGVVKLNKIELEIVTSMKNELMCSPISLLNVRKLSNTLERVYEAKTLIKDEINKEHHIHSVKKDDDGMALVGVIAVGAILGYAL